MEVEHVRSRFIKHFDGTTGTVYASPGRINIPTTTAVSYSPVRSTRS